MKCPFKKPRDQSAQYAQCRKDYFTDGSCNPKTTLRGEYHFCDERTEEEKTDLTQKLIDQYKPILEKLGPK